MPRRHGWAKSIRELTQEDKAALAGVDEPLCGWPECKRDANWEAQYEDLVTEASLDADPFGNEIADCGLPLLPESNLVNFHYVCVYCDEHARQFCSEGKIELPTKLATL